MTSKLVYIAGPYASNGGHHAIACHVHRAMALGTLAVRQGLVPIVPHASGWLGLYGAPGEEHARTREDALRCSTALARLVGEQGGQLWVIAREDGTRSPGTELEIAAYHRGQEAVGRPYAVPYTERPWSEWAPLLVAAGLWSEQDLLGGGR